MATIATSTPSVSYASQGGSCDSCSGVGSDPVRSVKSAIQRSSPWTPCVNTRHGWLLGVSHGVHHPVQDLNSFLSFLAPAVGLGV
eukprot:6467605-Amphidinium_carterae.1